jgi:hypothetical protein
MCGRVAREDRGTTSLARSLTPDICLTTRKARAPWVKSDPPPATALEYRRDAPMGGRSSRLEAFSQHCGLHAPRMIGWQLAERGVSLVDFG